MPASVLLVDDEPAWLKSLSLTLKGCAGLTNITTCQDSREVMALLDRGEIGLVLLDLTMPGLSGDKLVEITLRNQAEDRSCAIVLHSDRPDHDLVGLVRSCGATGYIRKTSDALFFAREVGRLLAL